MNRGFTQRQSSPPHLQESRCVSLRSRAGFGAGFTLIETIVVIATTTIVIGVLTTMIISFYRNNTYTLEESQAVGQARSGVENTLKYLREATYGSDGSYPIAVATTTWVTVYSNINSTAAIEQVKYQLLNGTLYQVILTPTGNPLTYAGATPATSTVATSVVNSNVQPVFRYFDSTNTELAPPVNLSAVRFITVNLVVDVNLSRAPVSYTLSGGASLRNL